MLLKKKIFRINFLEFSTFDQLRLYYDEKQRKMRYKFREKFMDVKKLWDLTNPDKQHMFLYQMRKFVLNALFSHKSIIVWDLADKFTCWYPEFEHNDIRKKIGNFCRSLARLGLIKMTQVRNTKRKRSITYKCRIFMLKDAPEHLVKKTEDDYIKYQHGFLEYEPDPEDVIEEGKARKRITAEVDSQLYNDEKYVAKVQNTNIKKKSINKKVKTGEIPCVKCSEVAFIRYIIDGTFYCYEHHDDIAGKTVENDEGKWIYYREKDFEKIK